MDTSSIQEVNERSVAALHAMGDKRRPGVALPSLGSYIGGRK